MKNSALNVTTALKGKIIFSSKEEKGEAMEFLRNFGKEMAKAANVYSIRLYECYLQREIVDFKSMTKEEAKELNKKFNKELGVRKNQLYHEVKEIAPKINTGNLSQLTQGVAGAFNGKNMKKIMNYEKNPPTFRSSTITIHNDNYTLKKIEDKYYIDITFQSSQVPQNERSRTFQFVTGAEQKAILDKIFKAYEMRGKLKVPDWEKVIQSNGLYKPGGLKLKYVEKLKAWQIYITCQHYKEQSIEPKRALSFRIGMKKMLQGCYSDAKIYTKNTEMDVNNSLAIEGNNVLSTYIQFAKRRRSYQYDSKHSNRKGNGRKKILEPTEKLRGKYDNFRDTENFNIAKLMVEKAALKNAVIGILDWSNLKSDIAYIPEWNWAELNEKLRNACKKAGVPFVEVKSYNVAKMCSSCGHIHEERSKSHIFTCEECGYRADLAYNSARLTSLLAWKKYCDENNIKADNQYDKGKEFEKILENESKSKKRS